jgi:hypothetical protein
MLRGRINGGNFGAAMTPSALVICSDSSVGSDERLAAVRSLVALRSLCLPSDLGLPHRIAPPRQPRDEEQNRNRTNEDKQEAHGRAPHLTRERRSSRGSF